MQVLTEQTESGNRQKNAARYKELDAVNKRLVEVRGIFKRLYEDNVSGRITDERFAELSADYEKEQADLKDRAARIEREIDRAREAEANVSQFMDVVRKYASFEKLTPGLLREFVDKIVVHEPVTDADGNRRQAEKKHLE